MEKIGGSTQGSFGMSYYQRLMMKGMKHSIVGIGDYCRKFSHKIQCLIQLISKCMVFRIFISGIQDQNRTGQHIHHIFSTQGKNHILCKNGIQVSEPCQLPCKMLQFSGSRKLSCKQQKHCLIKSMPSIVLETVYQVEHINSTVIKLAFRRDHLVSFFTVSHYIPDVGKSDQYP